MLRLRPAALSDAHTLYVWRTDPLTVAMFDGPPPASFADHVAWLTYRLARPHPALYVGIANGHEVGTIRLDHSGSAYDVSITVAPPHRGHGHGTALVRAVCLEAPNPSRLLARIRHDNAASQRTFSAAGFHVYDPGTQHTHVVYERFIPPTLP